MKCWADLCSTQISLLSSQLQSAGCSDHITRKHTRFLHGDKNGEDLVTSTAWSIWFADKSLNDLPRCCLDSSRDVISGRWSFRWSRCKQPLCTHSYIIDDLWSLVTRRSNMCIQSKMKSRMNSLKHLWNQWSVDWTFTGFVVFVKLNETQAEWNEEWTENSSYNHLNYKHDGENPNCHGSRKLRCENFSSEDQNDVTTWTFCTYKTSQTRNSWWLVNVRCRLQFLSVAFLRQ